VSLGNPFAALGALASHVVDANLGSLAKMGEAVGAAFAAEGAIIGGMLTGNLGMIAQGMDLGNKANLQFFSLGYMDTLSSFQGKVAHSHTPPRPREALELSGRVSLEGRAAFEADLSARFKIHHGGFGTTAEARLTNLKDFGSISVSGGLGLSAEARLDLGEKLKLAGDAHLTAGGSVRAAVGFDLAAACGNAPLLSTLCVKHPASFEALLGARAEVGGGFAHLRASLDLGFGFGIVAGPEETRAHRQVETPEKGPEETPKTDGPSEPADGMSLDDPQTFLHNPNLSFEDKIFLFCLSMAKKQEDKIELMMAKWDERKQAAAAENAKLGKGGKQDAGNTPAPGGASTPPGLPNIGGGLPGLGGGGGGGGGGAADMLGGVFGGAAGGGGGGLDVGSIVGIFKTLGPMALDLAGSTAPMWVPALSAACGAIPVVGPFITALGPMAIPLIQGGFKAASGAIKSGALDGIANGVMGAASGGGAAGGAAGPSSGHGPSNVGGDKTSAPAGAEKASDPKGAEMEERVKKMGEAGKPESEARFNQELSKEQQDLTKVYEMLTNMMKASHDTQMSSIRNMK
jgi:hypothetical protein